MSPAELAAMLVLGAVWGASYLFIRVAVPEFGPFPLMAVRVVIGAAILLLVPAVRRAAPALRRYPRELLVLAAVNAAVPYALIAAAELRVTASLAAIVGATVPLFSAASAALWGGERVTGRQAAGLLLGLAGVAALVGWSPLPFTVTTGLTILALLAASACYGFAGVYAKQRLAGVPGPALAVGQQLGAIVLLLGPAGFTAPAVMPSASALGAALALAAASTALAYLLYFFLIERIGPTRTPTVTYLIPVFGTTWGVLFLGETITPGMLAAMGLVLGSVGLVNGMRRPARRVDPALDCSTSG